VAVNRIRVLLMDAPSRLLFFFFVFYDSWGASARRRALPIPLFFFFCLRPPLVSSWCWLRRARDGQCAECVGRDGTRGGGQGAGGGGCGEIGARARRAKGWVARAQCGM